MPTRGVTTVRIGVIGAGIVGLSVARRLQTVADVEVTVIDKEPTVAAHQTGHNSNVVHSGVYYPPGSLKATLCRRGGELLRAYCAERRLPYEEVGKVIVAIRDDEMPRLLELAGRAKANGISGSRLIDASELHDREPHVRGLSALLVPETAVVDFRVIAEQLAGDIARTGGKVILGHPVLDVDVRSAGVHVTTDGHELVFDRLVVCAGLQSSLVARMVGAAPDPQIIPFRGEYFEIAAEHTDLVRGSRVSRPRPSISVPRSALHSRSWRPPSCRTQRRPGHVPGRVSVERRTASRRRAYLRLSRDAENGAPALANGCSGDRWVAEQVHLPSSGASVRARPQAD